MRGLKANGALARVPWATFRGRILILAVVGAAGPSLALAAVLRLGSGWPGSIVLAAGLCVAIAALCFIAILLRPIGRLAQILADPARLEEAARLPADGRDEPGLIMAGVADLAARVAGLHHRWVQRHPLTGLPTREYLLIEMTEDLDCRPDEMLVGTVRFGDYDRLAAFDPASAEAAIRRFAERLSAAVGKSRPLAHVDRDCFAIWFRNAPSAEAAATELQAICYALGMEIAVGEITLVPDIEAGIAVYPRDGIEPAALVARALVSLARSSEASTAARMLTSGAKHARERFALEQDLRHAIARDQFDLHFQPVVDFAQGRLVGAEALLRWHHPAAGMIAPSRFVPIIEDAGLTEEVGLWTLNAACREARAWQRQGLEGLKVAVNLSARQLRNPRLKQLISRTLDRHRLDPHALEIELTETAATEDAERTFALFTELRAMGISLAIDDFGSGYSSLSYVKNLPFDKLKIDREFVVKVHERRDSQAICRSLIELARGLGLKLLAEGVESEEEVRLLHSFGCTLFQGYYFSRPLTGEEFLCRARRPDWQTPDSGLPHDDRDERKRRMAG